MKKFYFSLLAMLFVVAFCNTLSAATAVDFWY